jgi:hypothetical protein
LKEAVITTAAMVSTGFLFLGFDLFLLLFDWARADLLMEWDGGWVVIWALLWLKP